MKSSLALFAEPVLAIARRLLWLSIWLLWIPVVVYIVALNHNHSLGILQGALLVVSLIGLVVINAETAVVIYSCRRSNPWFNRGLLQRWSGVGRWRRPGLVARPTLTPGLLPTLAPELLPTQVALPFVSVIVAAYLPNEQDIIEDTLLHWLTQVTPPAQGWEIILAYNSPVRLPVENRLQALARRYPALVLLPVAHSHSKAENLNAALQVATGEMTGIFDADHYPSADCLSRAWAWLYQGRYDMVQGRNIIRNAKDSWLTQLIAVEFECIYGVSHYGRSLLVDTALFGGSNGYWRTAALRHLGFHHARLTEDIDVTVRGLLAGYRLVHDPAIVTTELAPDNLRGLWLQRQRWSQGWLEVAGLHLGRVLRSPHLDQAQKPCWVLMLLFSQGFYPLVWQVVPMLLSIYLSRSTRDLDFENLNLVLMGLLTLSVVLQVAVAMGLRPAASTYTRRHGVLYCLLSPVYFWLKALIGMVAVVNHFSGSRVWHVTARTKSKPNRWMVALRGVK
ncbi:glycosyltransferase family 2 protein [Nodosilinea sp. LEGE 06152]|uniref:glycosyltransferase family 2 protein n=1 Tax=Nodosilinea sp. LEGE 06152 TaxID=2777966 RepID=UPI001880192E|nr:glycosyltransferase [Nodosilinea sp. LEGE 06152]MBE9156270.1 glycosyltransferase family 2 protein [Nodosilinea sp. LEGE 06152]